MGNPIIDACQQCGFYTLSDGTMEPATVLKRLLEALAVLDPSAHQQLLADDSRAAIPLPALYNELHHWWRTDAALQLVEDVIRAIDSAAVPHGYSCGLTAGDRLVLEKLDLGLADASTAAAPAVTPPRVSALRVRVRSDS